MPKISEMSPPPVAVTGLELIPILQGGDNAAIPLFAQGNAPRGQVLQLRRAFAADLSSTADADPGAGLVRWNNADPEAATLLYIDDVDGDAVDISLAWSNLDVGGFIYIQKPGDATDRANWQVWQVSSVVDASGYAKIGVTLQASSGMFADTDALELSIQKAPPSPGIDRNVVTALSSSSGVVTVDLSLGDYFTLALTENVTGWVFTNAPAGYSVMIEITQGAGPYTMAWDSTFKWAGGSVPSVSTANGAKDMLALTSFNAGGTHRATLGKGFA